MRASDLLTDQDPQAYWPSCDHRDAELRIHTIANGANHYKFECQTCGRRGNAIRRDHRIVVGLWSDPPMVDEGISRRWQERWMAEKEAEQLERRQEWFRQHNQYLSSPAWRERRAKVLARDKGLCQANLKGCERAASQVHHLTYAHWGNEPLFELEAICGPCHEQITAMDRKKRAA